MDFKGKICPYCKTEFKEDDEIVVCSVCEMPHHKDCWIENKACTTFGCTGTIVGAEQYSEEVDNKKFCSKCGADMNEGEKFCSKCGASASETEEAHFQVAGTYSANQGYQQNTYTHLQPQYIPHQDSAQQYNTGYNQYGQQQNDQDLYIFLQSNQPIYISKFQRMQIANTKTSWNWCGFLFGGCWYAFRKMYGIATAYIGVSFIAGLIPGIGVLLQLALCICSGIFGNHFYKQYIESELKIAKSMDSFGKSAYMAKKGGTSIGAVFGFIGIAFILGLITATM